jgi:hypothetical protein
MDAAHISQTLRRSLADWTDVDVACYYVAVALGIAPDPGDKWDFWGGKKWMFWSANTIGGSMYRVLEDLAQAGVLEKREGDDMQFRWNPEFDWVLYGENQTKA